MSNMRIDADFTPLFAQLDGIGGRVAEALRPATLEASMIVRREVEAGAPKSKAPHWFYSTGSGGEPHVFKRKGKNQGKKGSKYLFYPGDLKKSIYIKHLGEEGEEGKKRYYRIGFLASWKSKEYVPYAHMLEYGTRTQPARPFLRPAFERTKDKAVETMVSEILKAAYGT